ncbi:hypothetical protein [Fimbriiglobus ruber]|uniref:SWIM-type domain-containing protein n=1 Tax=Fimbriiglobus ruber TaxID=1908690 RepID=A0A225CZ03_9BACT|nr:hypothetical protein [Fimbriiglobus ruber]OWK34610.1 hypothetical protein FRUB_10581 [Fimbriiglobus ruber]
MKLAQPRPGYAVLSVSMPGADRRRTLAMYQFRTTYRNASPTEPGCVMTWEVSGGRLSYQVALERTPEGRLAWHCSCADAVYRGENNATHRCKHVRGLIDWMPKVT